MNYATIYNFKWKWKYLYTAQVWESQLQSLGLFLISAQYFSLNVNLHCILYIFFISMPIMNKIWNCCICVLNLIKTEMILYKLFVPLIFIWKILFLFWSENVFGYKSVENRIDYHSVLNENIFNFITIFDHLRLDTHKSSVYQLRKISITIVLDSANKTIKNVKNIRLDTESIKNNKIDLYVNCCKHI